MIDNQVRSLRKQAIIDRFKLREELVNYMEAKGLVLDEAILNYVSRKGAYWGTFTDIRDYELGKDILPFPFERTQELASLSTRLWKFSKEKQDGLVNWGYAACDAAMRRYVDRHLPNNATFPYPQGLA